MGYGQESPVINIINIVKFLLIKVFLFFILLPWPTATPSKIEGEFLCVRTSVQTKKCELQWVNNYIIAIRF